GSCRIIAGWTQNLRKWGTASACVVVNVRVTRRRRADGGIRGGATVTRRGGTGVRAAGLRGPAGPCRRAAGAGRPVGARDGAAGVHREDAAVSGGPGGRGDRRAGRRGRRGGRGM